MKKKNPAAQALGTRGGESRAESMSDAALSDHGRMMAKRRMVKLTPAKRSAIASKAAKARWKKGRK